jgi:hypothetical protein
MVEYRGRTGLSLPAGYQKQSRHRAYTIDHYFTQRSSKAITQSKMNLL